MSDAVLDGLLFDGRTAAAAPVRLTVSRDRLLVSTPAGEVLHEAPIAQVTFSDPFASAPRQVSLPGGVVVEVDGAALTAALAAAGRPAGLVDRMQQRWLAAVGALVASVALLAGGYLYGLPAAVRVAVAVMPDRAERRLGDGAMEILDGRFFGPSALSDSERASAKERIDQAARLGAPKVEYRLLFRSAMMKPGVNAFALPGGTVVILDELVRRTDGDDRLVAVVGHELGHLARHHPTQSLLRALGLGAAASLLWGDFSGQAANIPAVLAMLSYSRDAEREADDDAVRFLRAAGRTSEPMLGVLCLLAGVEREAGVDGVPLLLSSHPKIEERLAHLRAAAGAPVACPVEEGAEADEEPKDEQGKR